MSEAIDLAKQCLHHIDARDVKGIRALASPDITFWDPTGTYKGVDAVAGYFQTYADAMPNTTPSVIKTSAGSGDLAFLEVVSSAKHTGVLRTPKGDVPGTGRAVTIPYAIVARTEAGKICELRFYYDQMSFLAQLGLLPQPAGA